MSEFTVFLLGSRRDERHIKEFWVHLSTLRRQTLGVTWATVYVEDMVDATAIVPVVQHPYMVIGCLSPVFLSLLLDEPALREMVEGAYKKLPLIISPCRWDEYPSPFAGKVPFVEEAIASLSSRRRDAVLVECVGRLHDVVMQEVY